MSRKKSDRINPPHYNDSNITPIEVVRDWDLGFSLGNVVKYIKRYREKGKVEDLKKAQWYLSEAIESEEGL